MIKDTQQPPTTPGLPPSIRADTPDADRALHIQRYRLPLVAGLPSGLPLYFRADKGDTRGSCADSSGRVFDIRSQMRSLGVGYESSRRADQEARQVRMLSIGVIGGAVHTFAIDQVCIDASDPQTRTALLELLAGQCQLRFSYGCVTFSALPIVLDKEVIEASIRVQMPGARGTYQSRQLTGWSLSVHPFLGTVTASGALSTRRTPAETVIFVEGDSELIGPMISKLTSAYTTITSVRDLHKAGLDPHWALSIIARSVLPASSPIGDDTP